MSSAVGPPEQEVGKSATAEKTITLSTDTSNSSMNSHLGRPATARMPEIVETSQQKY